MNDKVGICQQVPHTTIETRETSLGSRGSRSAVWTQSPRPYKQRRLEDDKRHTPHDSFTNHDCCDGEEEVGSISEMEEPRPIELSALFAEHQELDQLEKQLRLFLLLEQIRILQQGRPEHDIEFAFAVLCSTTNIDVKLICFDVLLTAAASMEHHHMLLPVLIKAMKSHPQSELVQLGALRLIQRHLSQSCEKAEEEPCQSEKVLQLELGNTVLDSMNRFSDSVSLQGLALDILRHFTLRIDRPTGVSRDFWVAAIPAICLALSRYVDVEWIQLPGLSLTAWLAEDKVYRDGLWKVRCSSNAEGGMVDTILTSMQQHAADAVVQCNASATLCWLLHSPDGRTAEIDVGSHHNILLVARETLQRHSDDAAVFGNCVCLMTAVPASDHVNDDNAAAAVDEIVATGMSRHASSSKVQACCLRWMVRYAPGDIHRLVPFIPAVLQAMHKHPTIAQLQGQACGILATLANHSLDEVLKHGCVDAILTAIQRHPTIEQVQQGAAWLMIVAAEAAVPATHAFGGGLSVVDTIWRNLGVTGIEDAELDDDDDQFEDLSLADDEDTDLEKEL